MLASTENPTALEAKLFRGFADPSRLSVLKSLRTGERSVSEIVEMTNLSQPNVSAHLSCLRDCGLVVSRQDGRSVYYNLADERLEEVFLLAEDILTRIVDRIYNCTRYPQ
ncbi:MAG: helix-turn-helix transcriptional regulator [Armatimonadetes bacterium]|nr:helix-turn-helix transcriptional regulator [Armatimonadota bacterium]